ncbi:hypothetical protein QBZ16_002630 [Prototheca wickerhamii]|uniref:S-acyltransferase n=1 Tax=Prototheca wickerhamii TaxID=3111 RepID=A0AAD9IKM4_PROWI|nr:hypothetical protein QBZ16_002630 [Prototheca wickerhamii]
MVKETEPIDTVWKAAAYGDFDVLTRLASAEPASLHRPEEQGFYALQWAALNNRVAVLNYLLGAGCDACAVDPSGQTALHWAAHPGRGDAAARGRPLAARDGRGYTVAHVAAQYGQTAMLLHLAQRWAAELDAPDADGRTPLHWAAYKGHADALRLLLVAGVDAARADAEGCTPLHWAAIHGNAEACTLLVQGGGGDCLALPDATGATPSQLAAEKGHRALALVLAEAKARHERGARARRGRRRAALALARSCAPHAHAKAEDSGETDHAAARGDLQPLHPAALSGLDSPALAAGQWNQLCVACRIVRPLRAKHCGVTGRCVELYDHYCPWVGNVIGARNRGSFIVFLWLELGAIALAAAVAGARLNTALAARHAAALAGAARLAPGAVAWPVGFLVADAFLLLSVAALALAQANQAARNVTTNELANWHRYKYLHDAEGEFANPFDKGWRANCAEVWGARPPRPVYVLEDLGAGVKDAMV